MVGGEVCISISHSGELIKAARSPKARCWAGTTSDTKSVPSAFKPEREKASWQPVTTTRCPDGKKWIGLLLLADGSQSGCIDSLNKPRFWIQRTKSPNDDRGSRHADIISQRNPAVLKRNIWTGASRAKQQTERRRGSVCERRVTLKDVASSACSEHHHGNKQQMFCVHKQRRI